MFFLVEIMKIENVLKMVKTMLGTIRLHTIHGIDVVIPTTRILQHHIILKLTFTNIINMNRLEKLVMTLLHRI